MCNKPSFFGKPYICVRVMEKVSRYIGFCLVAVALWLFSAHVGVSEQMDGRHAVVHPVPVSYHLESDRGTQCFLPLDVPDAEVAENTGRLHYLNTLRVQRLSVAEYLASLKSWVTYLSRWVASLSLHREKLSESVAGLHGRQVCDYYVFMLRKILI